MKPYITDFSYRPGCTCCNSKHLHAHNPRTQNGKSARRSGKKAMRQILKKEMLTYE